MPRLRKGREAYDLVLVDPADSDYQVGLMIDKSRSSANGPRLAKWGASHVPTTQGQSSPAGVWADWDYQNGDGGAGWSIETPRSYQQGGCDYVEFGWLRRPGVVQPAGKLTEVELPAALAAITTGSFFNAVEHGILNQSLYLTTGTRYVLKIPNGLGTGTDAPVLATDFGAGAVTTDIAVFDGGGTSRLYVTCPDQNLRGSADGTTWAEVSGTLHLNYLATVHWELGNAMATGGLAGTGGTAAHRLIGTDADGNGFFHVAGDPLTNGNWSAETNVGSLAFPTFGVVSDGHVVWFQKPNGLHGVNGLGYSPNLTKWMESSFSPFQGSIAEYWDGKVWFDHQEGLVVIPVSGERQDIATFVNYGQGQSNKSPIWGKPTALTPCAYGMYVAYRSGTTASDSAYIGTVRIENGSPRWSMAECVIPGETVTFMRQTAPGGVPRLWIGTTDNATGELHLYFQSLPQSGDPEMDYLNGGPMEFAESWSWRSSRFNGGAPVDKMFRRYEVEADQLGGANQIAVSISAHGAAFVNQGTATSAVEGRWTGTPTSGHVRTPSAQIKLDVQNASSVPVIIRSVAAHYTPRPEQSKVVTVPIAFGEGVQLKHGNGTDQQDPGTVLATLERFQQVDPLTAYDPLGRTLEIIIEPGLDEQITESEDGHGWDVKGTLRYSISRIVALWDNSSWDSGELFS
jgi:hypothetical protein